jgi:DNA-binding NarL/FixJ family response regulator
MPYIPAASIDSNGQHHRHAWLKPQAPDSHLQQAMHPLKTFIVEDSPVIRENLIATLEELVPVEVVGTAEDETTAVQWLTRPSNQFDLVIVDIFLKGGSGLGVLRAGARLAQPCKLVVLSNYATSDMRRKCLELGAHRVFDKSNEIDALILYCGRLAAGESVDSDSGHGTLA